MNPFILGFIHPPIYIGGEPEPSEMNLDRKIKMNPKEMNYDNN